MAKKTDSTGSSSSSNGRKGLNSSTSYNVYREFVYAPIVLRELLEDPVELIVDFLSLGDNKDELFRDLHEIAGGKKGTDNTGDIIKGYISRLIGQPAFAVAMGYYHPDLKPSEIIATADDANSGSTRTLLTVALKACSQITKNNNNLAALPLAPHVLFCIDEEKFKNNLENYHKKRNQAMEDDRTRLRDAGQCDDDSLDQLISPMIGGTSDPYALVLEIFAREMRISGDRLKLSLISKNLYTKATDVTDLAFAWYKRKAESDQTRIEFMMDNNDLQDTAYKAFNEAIAYGHAYEKALYSANDIKTCLPSFESSIVGYLILLAKEKNRKVPYIEFIQKMRAAALNDITKLRQALLDFQPRKLTISTYDYLLVSSDVAQGKSSRESVKKGDFRLDFKTGANVRKHYQTSSSTIGNIDYGAYNQYSGVIEFAKGAEVKYEAYDKGKDHSITIKIPEYDSRITSEMIERQEIAINAGTMFERPLTTLTSSDILALGNDRVNIPLIEYERFNTVGGPSYDNGRFVDTANIAGLKLVSTANDVTKAKQYIRYVYSTDPNVIEHFRIILGDVIGRFLPRITDTLKHKGLTINGTMFDVMANLGGVKKWVDIDEDLFKLIYSLTGNTWEGGLKRYQMTTGFKGRVAHQAITDLDKLTNSYGLDHIAKGLYVLRNKAIFDYGAMQSNLNAAKLILDTCPFTAPLEVYHYIVTALGATDFILKDSQTTLAEVIHNSEKRRANFAGSSSMDRLFDQQSIFSVADVIEASDFGLSISEIDESGEGELATALARDLALENKQKASAKKPSSKPTSTNKKSDDESKPLV